MACILQTDQTNQSLQKKRELLRMSVNAYLILKIEDKLLLLLRQNTGYCDGMYGLVSGHVEDQESARQGIIREAFEEVGIKLSLEDLRTVHVMHRYCNRLNIDIFFECSSWQGRLYNMELHKCAALEYYPENHLPGNTVDYIKYALKCISEEMFYSEYGWSASTAL